MTKKNYINTIKNIDPWVAENTFYLKATPERISKFMSHYEIFNKIKNLKGDVVECGVFRGASLSRFMNFDKIFKSNKKFYAFDAFGKFPDSGTKEDKTFSKKHNKLGYGIKKKDLDRLLKKKGFKNFTLIEGDVLKTLNVFLKKKKKICLLHLDLDVYEATKHVLKNLFPLIVKNGIILIDDYSHISNTTKAINNFLKVKKKLKIKKFTFPCRPSYIIKDF